MSDISAINPATQPTATKPVGTLPAGDNAKAGNGTQSVGALNGVNANTFLQLLVSELQNQNPSNPTDPTQFLTQTASFEEVQELDALQTSVSSMVSAQQSSSATSMLGMQVTGSDSSGNPVSGVVNGVQLTAAGPILSVGKSSVPYSTVTSVTLPDLSTTDGSNSSATGAAAPSSSSSSTGSN